MLSPTEIRTFEEIHAKFQYLVAKIAELKVKNTALETENVTLKVENIALKVEKQKNVGYQEVNTLIKEVLLCEKQVKQKITLWTMACDANHAANIKLQRLLKLYNASGVRDKAHYKKQHTHQNGICQATKTKERQTYQIMNISKNKLLSFKKKLEEVVK